MGDTADIVVLGAGPAGLGAGLAAARAGARVVVVEARERVGGLCVTDRRGDVRFDWGGHVPFVRDAARLRWLRGLLGDDLVWVPRPVASFRDGRVRPGRYLDQRADGRLGTPAGPAVDPPPPSSSAQDVLNETFGAALVDREMRPYLEKIDGVPLARIPGPRPLRLMRDQAAPDGFWFPRLGIGRLMDAMAEAIAAAGGTVHTGTRVRGIEAPGGRVAGVALEGPGAPDRIVTDRLVVSAAPGRAAVLLRPDPPDLPDLRMRAVVIVVLAVSGGPLTGEAWVQVDDPAVPAARIFEMGNWSPDMAPGGDTVIGFECYCHPLPEDPVWGASDADLATRCAASLAAPLGWLDDPARARCVAVVRLPVAYPLPDLAQLEAAGAGARILAGVEGVVLAPGAAVIEAVEHGEAAVAAP
ncbi:MAG: FAD-dependent oxidoreductase [Thermoleophilia bacterium]|nr:FAD-dependent oxidoreductase [Thermoleophilia bacterium]